MSLVLDRNFQGAVGAAFTDSIFSISAGSPVFASSHYGVGARFPSGTQAHITYALASPTTTPGTFSLIVKQAQPTGQVVFFQTRHASGQHVTMSRRTDGKLQLAANSGAVNATSALALPTAVEFRIDLTLTSATAATATVYPDITSTTPLTSVSISAFTAQTVTQVRMGATDTAASGVDITLAWPQHETTTTSPGLRKYVYAAVDKTSFIVPELVSVTVGDENLPAGTKTYTVNFGDGTTVGPQSSPNFTHTYTVAGAYDITPTAEVT